MGPTNTVGYLLHHTATILTRQADQVLQERLGIGMSQLKLLMMLRLHPGIQQRKLADYLGQTEASISRQAKLLSEKGMLRIRVNPKSRREHIMITTAKGVKMTEAALDVLAQHNEPMLQQLTEKQQQQLIDMLATLHGWVCATGKPFACDHPFNL